MPETLDLNFRAACKGGGIDANKAQQYLQALCGRSHLIFFIHGYNDPQCDAEDAYQAFSARIQDAIVGSGRDWAPGANVVHVFWPGDASWGFLSAAYYPWAVPRAQQIAALFANMLETLGSFASGVVTVDFVAHSLGNRLLLRTLAILKPNARIWIRRVVHMAAAVPRWKLDDFSDSDALASGIAREANATSRATSLYSGDDLAVGIAFQIGETFTSLHDGWFPISLGSRHWMPYRPNPLFSQLPVPGAGHGDYWGAEDDKASQDEKNIRLDAARKAYSALNLASSATRSLPNSKIPARSGEPARVIVGRVTAIRGGCCML